MKYVLHHANICRVSSHFIRSWKLGVEFQIYLQWGLCYTHMETLQECPRFLSMFVWASYYLETPLPLLTLE